MPTENIKSTISAAAAESRVMKRELDFKLEQLNERRAELKQDQELVKSEKIEISRQKDQLKVRIELLRLVCPLFSNETLTGMTSDNLK